MPRLHPYHLHQNVWGKGCHGRRQASVFIKDLQMGPVCSKVREPLTYAIPLDKTQIFYRPGTVLGPRWVLGIGNL